MASASVCPNNPNRCRGFSMLEVLITVVLFSVGALALGALQLKSKQAAYEAVQRTLATELANDLIERMRMNTASLVTYVSNSGTRTFDASALPAAPANDADCSASTVACTAAQLAQYDLHQWFQRLRGSTDQRNGSNTGGLVEPTVCLSGSGSGASGLYSVAIAWRGQEILNDSISNACGQSNYDTGYRRLLVFDVYITN